MRIQGWDPVVLICQIISLQTIHYLVLSLLVPPLVQTLTNPTLLTYSGGPSTVGHILDWREMAGRPTVSSSTFNGLLDVTADGWKKLRGAWAGGKQIGELDEEGDREKEQEQEETIVDSDRDEMEKWDLGVDDGRGWILGIAWLIASAIDIAPLYYLIRRPTHILDFSLTLNFVHLILTSYYAKSFPTSMFFWVVQGLGALMMIVVAEQLCVKREMNTDLDIGWKPVAMEEEEIELSNV